MIRTSAADACKIEHDLSEESYEKIKQAAALLDTPSPLDNSTDV